jgi:hypothetical protein
VFIHHMAEVLAPRFKINHPTMQTDVDQHAARWLAPDNVVEAPTCPHGHARLVLTNGLLPVLHSGNVSP